MFKKVSAFLIAAALIGGVTSCYMPDTIFSDNAFEDNSDTTEEKKISVYDFEFDLSGVEYQLPVNYSVISARGWKLTDDEPEASDDDASDLPAADTDTQSKQSEQSEEKSTYKSDTIMQPGEYSDYVPVERSSEYIALKFYNDGKKPRQLDECLVVGIMVEPGGKEPVDFSLHGDITLGKTYEEVVTTYGKPSYTKDIVSSSGEFAAINDIAFIDDYDEDSDDLTRTLYYSVADTSVVSFELGDYEGKSDSVVRITMDNTDSTEEEYDPSKDLKIRSSVINLYKSPNLLGKTFDDFAFKYENVLYTLPMPVQKLIDDGWVFVRGAADRIPIGTTRSGVIMRKGNLAMEIIVHNYDLKRAQAPINCYAVSLSASVVGPNVKILMPKGVTLGSDYSELVTAYGDEYAELSGYIEESEQEQDGQTAENEGKAETKEKEINVGSTEKYELTKQEGCTIVKTVEEDYTLYSYIMPDDVPTITLPVSITDIKDPHSDLLGENRKRIDVYVSNVNDKILKIYLQNCPEYYVNEAEIFEQQMEAAAQQAEKESAGTSEGTAKSDKSEKAVNDDKSDKTSEDSAKDIKSAKIPVKEISDNTVSTYRVSGSGNRRGR